MTCINCDKPLDWAPQKSNPYTQYCLDCKKCRVCHNYISPQDLNYCIKFNLEATCLMCLSMEMRDGIENKKIEITQKELDYLNAVRLMIFPNCDFSIETNMKDAEYRVNNFVLEMSLEQKYLFLKRIESIAATCSILLKKDRRTIELELTAKEREKYEAARSKQDIRKVEQTPLVKIARVSKTPRDKAIAALINLGLSEEDAIKSMDDGAKLTK